MKKLYLLLIGAMFVVSCSSGLTEKPTPQTEQLRVVDGTTLSLYRIDGCEYIGYLSSPSTVSYANTLTHKGDCDNPIHVYNRIPVSE